MSVAAFYIGRGRSIALVGGPGHGTALHSLPGYYGYFTAIWCLLPALAILLLWSFLEPRVIVALVVNGLPDAQQALSSGELDLLVNNIRNLAAGDAVSGDIDVILREASLRYQ
jgi:phosphate transport system permease protein